MRIPHALLRRLPLLAMLLVTVAAFGTLPSTAAAAEQFQLRDYGTKCVSGQTDERRFTYLICHDEKLENYLRVLDPQNRITTTLRMPGANDVAPAPDGSYVYVSGGGTYPLRRFVRGLDGTYSQDNTYVAPTFTHWGDTYRADGRQIATDGYGNLYVANGMWMNPAPHVVTKFSPTGRLLAKWGDFSNTWNTGTFYSLSGIGVSRDGKHVYTSEVHNGRVQRFDQQADGSYRYATQWGNDVATDPYHVGLCMPTKFAAPYDLTVDGWGNVWVASTTCTYVQKFTADGIFLFGSYVGNRGTTGPGILPNGDQQRLHNIAADASGNLIAGETSTWLVHGGALPAWPPLDGAPAPAPVPVPDPVPTPGPVPTPDPVPAPDPQPAPDVSAPAIDAVLLPATTATRDIDVKVTAHDDVAVTQVRLATEDGNWKAWQAFTPTVRFTLTAGLGLRGVYVQVRDAAGRESNIVYRLTMLTGNEPAPAPAPDPVPDPAPAPDPAPDPAPAPVDAAAPVLSNVVVPATSRTSAIDVAITATDDVGVTQVRMADDWGTWGPWQAYAPTMRFTLRAGIGYRGVYVQVRDAAGRESATLYRRVTVTG